MMELEIDVHRYIRPRGWTGISAGMLRSRECLRGLIKTGKLPGHMRYPESLFVVMKYAFFDEEGKVGWLRGVVRVDGLQV